MKKKLVALFLVAVMALSIMPAALAANGNLTTAKQIDDPGGLIYYNDIGGTSAALTDKNFVVSTSKTIDALENENEFKITLKVETVEEVKNFSLSPDLAVALVIDVSTSMQYPPSVNSSGKNDHTLYYDSNRPEYVGGLGYYNSSTRTGWNVYETYKTGKSRMDIARTMAYEFLDSYLGDQADLPEAERAKRLISIATFGTDAEVRCDWVNISTAAGMTAAKTAINNMQAQNIQYTFLQGGLQIAKNLIGRQAVAAIDGKDKYVVVLTDGNPTYLKTLTSNDQLSTASTISGGRTGATIIENVVESEANVRACRTPAVTAATAIKNTNAKLYTIGFAINDLVVDGATGGQWLGNAIATNQTYNFSTSDSISLQIAFENIAHSISNWAEAWTVTDPMGPGIVFNGFITDPESVNAEINSGKTEISWDLKGLTPISTYIRDGDGGDGKKVSVYELSYKVTLDTFTRIDSDVTNGKTDLIYVVKNQENASQPTYGDKISAPFKIPEVHGYSDDLVFTKVNKKGDPLAGAEFELRYNGQEIQTAKSDANGIIKFENIPSGHCYTLVETKAPAGYRLDTSKYDIIVSFGALSIPGVK